MPQYKEPLRKRTNPKDENVRLAGDPRNAIGSIHSKFPHYEPMKQSSLTGEFEDRGTVWKPDRPTGKTVAIPNGGPDSRWPGIYPTRGE